MGGAQAYEWAVQYPGFVDGIVPICSSARNAIHNSIFLEGVKSALIGARHGVSCGVGKGQRFPSAGEAEDWTAQQKEVGLKAFGRVYAGWGLSQTFYRQQLYKEYYGFNDADDFLSGYWEPWALSKNPDDLLVMLQTWQLSDISASSPEFKGDLIKVLRSIKGNVLICPSQTDMYFPPEDSKIEADNIGEDKATLCIIPSIWGHWAGSPEHCEEDAAFLDAHIARFLDEL